MKLNTLFQDGAVLQRGITIPVWGDTTPGTIVRAALNGTESFTRATSSGDFLLRLPAQQAGGPYELVVSNEETGEQVVVKDVLVGDVWIASGQSNMQYLLGSQWAAADPTNDNVQAIQTQQLAEFCETIPDSFNLRFFTVKQTASGVRESDADGCWQRMTAETAGECTAVGAWFGRFVQEAIKIPVGIIHTSWGGTIAEAWTSRGGLMSNPLTAGLVPVVDASLLNLTLWKNGQESGEHFEQITKVDPGNEGVGKGWAEPSFDDALWDRMDIPGSWLDQKIGGNGSVWIRTALRIPEAWRGHDVIIHTGGIDKHDTTYFNGVEIGRTGKEFETQWWNAHREYRIPAALVKPGEVNGIAIRAYSFMFQGAFWGKKEDYYLRCDGTDEKICIAGSWRACMEYDMGRLLSWSSLISYGPGNPNTPGILFDGMIAPILPYGIKGAIWYQGESNAKGINESIEYRSLLATMISDWRYNWSQGDFPFIQVQLANWRAPQLYHQSTWAHLRESQRLVCQDLPEVYMIPALDIGDEVTIHPQNKKDVGKRLADNALANVYGRQNVVADGPMFRGIRREGHEIRVFFDFADGLKLTEDGVKSFYLGDAAGVFNPADAIRIEGSTVVLSSTNVALPVNVRYCWADNPTATLFNGAGLPASSFSSL